MHGADGVLSIVPVQLRAGYAELAWLSTAGQLAFGRVDKTHKLRSSIIGEYSCALQIIAC